MYTRKNIFLRNIPISDNKNCQQNHWSNMSYILGRESMLYKLEFTVVQKLCFLCENVQVSCT
jgi:hypothetical protein